jgi:hypothetical protein
MQEKRRPTNGRLGRVPKDYAKFTGDTTRPYLDGIIPGNGGMV